MIVLKEKGSEDVISVIPQHSIEDITTVAKILEIFREKGKKGLKEEREKQAKMSVRQEKKTRIQLEEEEEEEGLEEESDDIE